LLNLFIDDPPSCSLKYIPLLKERYCINICLAVSADLLGKEAYNTKIATVSEISHFLNDVTIVNHTNRHDDFFNLSIGDKLLDIGENDRFISRMFEKAKNNLLILPKGKIENFELVILALCGYQIRGVRKKYRWPKSLIIESAFSLYEGFSVSEATEFYGMSNNSNFYTHDISDNPSVFGVTPNSLFNFLDVLALHEGAHRNNA